MNSPQDRPLGTLFVTMTALVSPAHHQVGFRPLYPTGGDLQARPWLQAAINRLVQAVLTWDERQRQRQRLAELDDHLLRDIGLTRAEVRAEAEKPFWRA